MAKILITLEELKAKLSYSPVTGLFSWRTGQRYKEGVIAGTRFNGYIIIKLNQRRYRAHRLAWLYMTGEWPKNEVDHDGVPVDADHPKRITVNKIEKALK